MSHPIHRVVIYTRKLPEMVDFYTRHFGFEAHRQYGDIVELRPKAGGLAILLHPASKGQKEGQALVKLIFDVEDVAQVRSDLIRQGLEVGPIHEADGYSFANAKDPGNNSISISSRAYSTR